MGKAIGIDFGTTYSCMAVMQDGKPVVIPNAEGDYLTPSVVTIDETETYMVGVSAKRRAIHNPKDTICSFKRLIGHGFNRQLAEDIKWQAHTVTIGTENDYRIMLQGKDHSLQDISSLLFKKLKVDAEAWLGEEVTEVVITVPARFDHNQRQLVREAAKSAGLTVLRIINEPTAACLAYGWKNQQDKTIAVYHLGGGTFDTSIISVGEGTFLVYATTGNNYLGGDDFDRRVVQWLCDGLKHKHKVDVTTDKVALQRLRDAAERAKCELSSAHETIIELPCIINTEDGFIDYDVTLTRQTLEKLVSDLIDETIVSCKQVLDYSKDHISRSHLNEKLIIDEVLLVGGQTRMPLVSRKVGEFFKKEPRRGVHPDEAVAVGAAIQAGVLKGEVKDMLLLDVTPLTLGIEIPEAKISTLIPRNTTIPTSHSELFTTATDNQSSVEIHVLQGESARLNESVSLGHLMLHGILPAPKGVPQIEVTFDIDANGILNVKAHDRGTGMEQRITIAGSL